MAIIKQLTDLFKTTKVYPVTLAKAVYTEDGHRLSDILDNISGGSTTYVTPEMFGAKGDGVTDDTDALNACFSNTKCKNIRIENGRYYITDIVYIESDTIVTCNNAWILIDSYGAFIANKNCENEAETDSNITINGLNIRTVNNALGYSLVMSDVNNLNIKGLNIIVDSNRYGTDSTGLTNGAWATYISGENITMSDIVIDNWKGGIWYDGLHFGTVNHLTVNNFLIKAGDDAIVFAPIDRFKPNKMNKVSSDINVGNGTCFSYCANCVRVGGVVSANGISMPDAVYKDVYIHDIVYTANEYNCLFGLEDMRAGDKISDKHGLITFKNIQCKGEFTSPKPYITLYGYHETYDTNNYENNYSDIIIESCHAIRGTTDHTCLSAINIDNVTIKNCNFVDSQLTTIRAFAYINVKNAEIVDCNFACNTTAPEFLFFKHVENLYITRTRFGETLACVTTNLFPENSNVEIYDNVFNSTDTTKALVYGTSQDGSFDNFIFDRNIYKKGRQYLVSSALSSITIANKWIQEVATTTAESTVEMTE